MCTIFKCTSITKYTVPLPLILTLLYYNRHYLHYTITNTYILLFYSTQVYYFIFINGNVITRNRSGVSVRVRARAYVTTATMAAAECVWEVVPGPLVLSMNFIDDGDDSTTFVSGTREWTDRGRRSGSSCVVRLVSVVIAETETKTLLSSLSRCFSVL